MVFFCTAEGAVSQNQINRGESDALAVMSSVLNQFRKIVNKDAVLVYIESGPVIL